LKKKVIKKKAKLNKTSLKNRIRKLRDVRAKVTEKNATTRKQKAVKV
jgi:hypothetical protein